MPSKGKPRKANFHPWECRTENSPYGRITLDMIKSPAWGALHTQARLLYVIIKATKWMGNNGKVRDISFTYAEGQEYLGYSQRTFTRAIDALITSGFLDLVEHWPHSVKPNIYGFSDRWHKYGKPDFATATRFKRKTTPKQEQA